MLSHFVLIQRTFGSAAVVSKRPASGADLRSDPGLWRCYGSEAISAFLSGAACSQLLADVLVCGRADAAQAAAFYVFEDHTSSSVCVPVLVVCVW